MRLGLRHGDENTLERCARRGRAGPAGAVLRQAARRRRPRVVLLVDDERWVLDALSKQLAWRFCDSVQIETCQDGEAALQRLQQGPVDVILSDLRMPGVDGLDLLRQAREIQPLALRMMLLGPQDFERVVSDARQVDVFRHISKPWRLDHVLAHFQAAFDQAAQAVPARTGDLRHAAAA